MQTKEDEKSVEKKKRAMQDKIKSRLPYIFIIDFIVIAFILYYFLR